jgi:hypothetical protein
MSDRDDGGPAFPTVEFEGHGEDRYKVYLGGMTMRDYFAAKALPWCLEELGGNAEDQPPHYAQAAYQIADAMLAERAKP